MRQHALIALFLAPLSSIAAPIEVAIIDGSTQGSAPALSLQLEDSTAFDFAVTTLTSSDVNSSADLASFDVVLLGESGWIDVIYNERIADAVEDFQDDGGGVVTGSWLAYNAPSPLFDPIMPVDTSSTVNRSYCGGPTTITVVADHPVVGGLTELTDSSRYTETPNTLDADATALATASCNGDSVVSVATPATGGRQAYLGILFMGDEATYSNGELRSGQLDQLIEQTVAWAAGCADEDEDGVSVCNGDCDDTDPARFPGNTESCDGLDNDCDDVLPEDELDQDFDGFSTCEGDCDDGDPVRYPGNTEICDDIDNDCDGSLSDQELDLDEDGITGCDGDCDDDDPRNFPGNVELCDERDNDCSGVADDDEALFFDAYPDADADSYGDAAGVQSVCVLPEDFVLDSSDCDDTSADVNPSAEEIPNNDIDEDCDGEDLTGCGCSAAVTPAGGVTTLALFSLLALWRRRQA